MSTAFPVGFCVSGKGRLFRSAAVHAESLGIEPAVVIADSRADDSLEDFCACRSIPLYRIPSLPRAEFNRELDRALGTKSLSLVALTFDKIVPPETVARFDGRMINLHPGLLPSFAGMDALGQAIAGGVRYAGATMHEVDETVDGGPIIAQCVTSIRRGESPADLGRRLFPLMRLMYLQVIAWYAEGRVEHDEFRRVWIRDAVYGELPISPAIERAFED